MPLPGAVRTGKKFSHSKKKTLDNAGAFIYNNNKLAGDMQKQRAKTTGPFMTDAEAYRDWSA